MKPFLAATVLGLSTLSILGGCASRHEEGVTSTIRTQYADAVTDVRTTTMAAKDVLMDKGLKGVTSNATAVDGTAMGKLADGTEVHVVITKNETHGSDIAVTVGTLGSPTLGAEIAKAIKTKANAGPTTMQSTM